VVGASIGDLTGLENPVACLVETVVEHRVPPD
jgi:hypothetical protein